MLKLCRHYPATIAVVAADTIAAVVATDVTSSFAADAVIIAIYITAVVAFAAVAITHYLCCPNEPG